jgi:hypothetical protein
MGLPIFDGWPDYPCGIVGCAEFVVPGGTTYALPALFAFALRRQWHMAWVAEDGYRRRAGKRRVLRRLVIAKPNPQTEFAFHEKGRLS